MNLMHLEFSIGNVVSEGREFETYGQDLELDPLVPSQAWYVLE